MVIRKISIGTDYRNSMHYICNQSVLNDKYIIHLIRQNDDGSVSIYIERSGEVILWKTINANIPFVLEANIDF